jgi:hypothetical protein
LAEILGEGWVGWRAWVDWILGAVSQRRMGAVGWDQLEWRSCRGRHARGALSTGGRSEPCAAHHIVGEKVKENLASNFLDAAQTQEP